MKRLWTYFSENISGNLHAATAYINTYHPEWDVVAMTSSGYNTVVVHRVEREQPVKKG